MTYTPPSNPSPTHQTFLAFVEAVQAKDHVALMTTFDDSAEIEVLPKSLARPKRDKAGYGEVIKMVWANFKDLEMTIYEVIEAGSAFTVHAASKGESISGTPWNNEYIFVIHFNTGTAGGLPKIVSLKEFVDSASMGKFFVADAAAKSAASS
ncbi:hypothetical protein C8R44DRAFT_689847 [Mycena epipterygia]|nr:hypothetical protein C8R44DRAFT_689847 [Mycena epipterygia]